MWLHVLPPFGVSAHVTLCSSHRDSRTALRQDNELLPRFNRGPEQVINTTPLDSKRAVNNLFKKIN